MLVDLLQGRVEGSRGPLVGRLNLADSSREAPPQQALVPLSVNCAKTARRNSWRWPLPPAIAARLPDDGVRRNPKLERYAAISVASSKHHVQHTRLFGARWL